MRAKKELKDYSLLVRCSSDDVKRLRKANINICDEVRTLLKQMVKELK